MLARAGDLAEYLADHYGTCALGDRCSCLRGGWVGQGCPHWRPTGARTWDELAVIHRRFYEGT